MKKILKAFLICLFLLSIVLLVNTLLFSSRQISVAAVPLVTVDDNAINRLSKAVQIPTISWTKEKIDTVAVEQFIDYVIKTFPLVHQQLDRTSVNDYSMIYKWRGKDKTKDPILLLAHHDVVPIEDQSYKMWKEDPFSGIIKNGFLWGRGTVDDKMSVIGLLEAAEMLIKSGFEPERTIYFGFGHDEEVTGLHGAKKIAQLLEEQGLRFDFILDEGGISLSGIIPGESQKVVSMIAIAEKGILNLDLTVKLEEGGHAAMPPRDTPISILSNAILKLSDNPLPSRMNGQVNNLTYDFMGPEMNKLLKMVFANRWLFSGAMEWGISKDPKANASIRTTLAPTIIGGGVKDNVLPTIATAKFNCRIIPEDNIDYVMKYVNKVIADERVVVTISKDFQSFNPSPISPIDSDGFNLIQTTIHEIIPGTVIVPTVSIGATDSRYYSKLSDNIYRYSPIVLNIEELKMVHGINERISVENYNRLVAFYYRLMENSDK